MSQDVIADTLNNVMNAKKAGKKVVVVKRFSKLLLNVLEIAKKLDYIEDYKTDGTDLEIEIGEGLNKCGAIKPRYTVAKEKLDRYLRRYLPAFNLGVVIVSTNKGLMTHQEVLEKNIGGCLVAYFY